MISPAEIRAQAARIVSRVSSDGKSLDALLNDAQGSPQERGLLRTLVYGTVRWQIRLEATLDVLSARPQTEIEPTLRALTLVGLFQLLHTDIATHAAVAETVEATRALKQARAAGFVNALLRRCLRERAVIEKKLAADIAARTAHPGWLIAMLKNDWPDRYPEILEANNAHPPMWLRVNVRRADIAEYVERLRIAGHAVERNEFLPEALRLIAPVDVRTLPGFSNGEISVQDAAAQLAARLLAPGPGMRVLDACAAPGGKTCHLLELQPNLSELIAIDVSPERLERVRENLERLRLGATVHTADAADPGSWPFAGMFDCILLDVPCSATGVIRRHPDIKLLRREADIGELAKKQAQLLRRVWQRLAPGGRLLYASCSALRAETSDVVRSFLKECQDAIDLTAQSCFSAGVKSAPGGETHPGLAISAGEAQMDGFYYACLGKR